MKVRVKRFDKSIPLPVYEKMAAGLDFVCRKGTTIKAGEIKPVPTNVAIEIPEGYVLFLIPRSSTSVRTGLVMPHSIGVVDPFYRGDDNEIILLFQNTRKKSVKVFKGDRLGQGVFLKYEKVKLLEVNRLTKSKRKAWKVKRQRKN